MPNKSNHQQTMGIVLASGSPYRASLLKNARLLFSIDSADIDETPKSSENAQALSRRLAQGKACAIASRWPQHLVIGSDQVAELVSPDGNLILNKPLNRETAFEQLTASSGQTIIFHTGCIAIDTVSNRQYELHDQYSLTYRELSTQEINSYIDMEKPFDCAGSIKAEGLGSALIAKHKGQDPATLMGLPMIKIISLLKNYGISPFIKATKTNANE